MVNATNCKSETQTEEGVGQICFAQRRTTLSVALHKRALLFQKYAIPHGWFRSFYFIKATRFISGIYLT